MIGLPLIYPFCLNDSSKMQQFRTDSLFPQGHKFHDMIAKGNSASFEQAVQELSQSKKRPAVFFEKTKQKPEAVFYMFPEAFSNAFRGGVLTVEDGKKAVYFLPSQVMAMGLVPSRAPVRYCLAVRDITGVHSKTALQFSFFIVF